MHITDHVELAVRHGRRRLAAPVLAAALAVALALPTGAAAKVYTLNGKVKGDSNSDVSVKVVVRNGEPQRLKGLTYRNLDATCNVDGTTTVPAGELSGTGGKNVGPSVEVDNSFRWVSYPDDGARYVNMFGNLKKGGRLIKATLEVYDNDPAVCAAAKGTVTLRQA
jgi:hypothetical protein